MFDKNSKKMCGPDNIIKYKNDSGNIGVSPKCCEVADVYMAFGSFITSGKVNTGNDHALITPERQYNTYDYFYKNQEFRRRNIHKNEKICLDGFNPIYNDKEYVS